MIKCSAGAGYDKTNKGVKPKGWIVMKEKLIRFMQGRYGVDSFSKAQLVVGLVLVLLTTFVRGNIGNVLYLLGWALVIWCYIRVFSKNITKRAEENQLYLNKTYKLRNRMTKTKNRMMQSKDYHFYTCPNAQCKQKIRIPRGKGKIEIRCPKCGTTFVKKS